MKYFFIWQLSLLLFRVYQPILISSIKQLEYIYIYIYILSEAFAFIRFQSVALFTMFIFCSGAQLHKKR